MRARIYAHFSSMPLAQSAACSLQNHGCTPYAFQIVSNPCPKATHLPFVGGSLFPACSGAQNVSWPLAVPSKSSFHPLFPGNPSEKEPPHMTHTTALPAAVWARSPKDGVTLMIQTDSHLASPTARLLKCCGGQGIFIF